MEFYAAPGNDISTAMIPLGISILVLPMLLQLGPKIITELTSVETGSVKSSLLILMKLI